ncbi:hypothetical protein C1H46_039209 [Malus baccata]|uniref:Major facilitator superfamily (MFS) profile domain-containing protein n=1 Tax=Malus baccata TaxID=106549 RepID=A0A540KLZ8_MALBA|nr:hypothetical protein C1H46_039209 [Malus baccata]
MEGIGGLRHLFMTVFLHGFASFMVIPAITDIIMLALCPGRDECSLAIYLSGFQQAMIGLGTVVMTPLIGNLSDVYGRKSLLTIPMTLSIVPLAILAYSRKTSFFYAYYVLRTVTALVGEGSINCLTLAYVADNVSERERISAFGILAGFTSAAFVCGTLAARFLSTASTFQVAAFASMLSTIYMRIFLKESLPGDDSTLRQPILKGGVPEVVDEGDVYSPKTIQMRSIASKQVGPNDQGKAQGCISGISSFANIVSPLIFSPLTALFLSEEAPFYFPGFSILCIGLATIIAFVQSLMIRASPHKTSTNICVESP